MQSLLLIDYHLCFLQLYICRKSWTRTLNQDIVGSRTLSYVQFHVQLGGEVRRTLSLLKLSCSDVSQSIFQHFLPISFFVFILFPGVIVSLFPLSVPTGASSSSSSSKLCRIQDESQAEGVSASRYSIQRLA